MKLLKKIMIVLAIVSAGTLIESKVQAQAAVSFQVFYDDLSPYGRWVSDPEFGYVWMPANVAGFSPYSTGGHWVWTNFGWTWVSDYPWGWAPFHYGRWRYNDFYGWQWVPGNVWGPAWVSWRRARGYYGWAPMAPGISVSVAIGPHYNIPHERWVFVNERYIGDPNVSHYYAPHSNNVSIINNSTVINNTYVDKTHNTTFVSGPGRDEVQKSTGQPVKEVAIRENSKPGQSVSNGKEVSMYRPVVKENDSKGADKPAPQKVTDIKDVKTINGKEPPADNKSNQDKAAPDAKNKDAKPVEQRDDKQPAPGKTPQQEQKPVQDKNPPHPQQHQHGKKPNADKPKNNHPK